MVKILLFLATFDSMPRMEEKKKKVLLGMSGGVDSSVSAVLLLEAGYEVIGAFMKNWSDCQWREDRRDAMRVAAKLGIEFHTLDFEKEYREKVVQNLFDEYAAGRTPNPDVLCNKYVKFDLFVKTADRLGCDYVATGHYARSGVGHLPTKFGTAGSPNLSEDALSSSGDHCLIQAQDQNKDQTYFLWAMPREVLSRTLFPLGDLTKPEVREIARKHDLSVAEKKDSVGICFVGEVDIVEFLKQEIEPKPGPVVTTDGRVVGEHEGLAFFTIGQRHGLGVVGGGPPYYVVRKDAERNTLIVGTEVDPELFSEELTAGQLNWLAESPKESFDCLVRVRYRQDLQQARVELKEDNVKVVFKESQRAITPGQSLVMYTEDGVVLGGGIINTQ